MWLLPADRAKNGHAHKVMLSRQSIALLLRQKRNARTAFVFPGPVSGAHLTRNSVAKAIAATLDRSEEANAVEHPKYGPTVFALALGGSSSKPL